MLHFQLQTGNNETAAAAANAALEERTKPLLGHKFLVEVLSEQGLLVTELV
jgi:hypothetical protein